MRRGVLFAIAITNVIVLVVTGSGVADPTTDPWVDGPNDAQGYIACTILGAALCSFDPNDERRFPTEVESGIRTITAGLEWDPALLGASQELILQIRQEPDLLVEARGGPGFQVRLDLHGLDDTGWLAEFRILTPLGEPQLVYQQPFTLYWTLHYWEPAPPGYSTMP